MRPTARRGHSRAVSTRTPARPLTVPIPGAGYSLRVLGYRPTPLRDLYHLLLTARWPYTFGLIALGYLAANAIFATLYLAVGGVAHARPGSFLDAFYFSVQTMGTIGYGTMYPESHAANALVVLESIVSLSVTALAAGLVFAKFSRPSARIVFSDSVTIAPEDGVDTLTVRIGNERGNAIVDAVFRVVLVRTEKSSEGKVFYRSRDLVLRRERALSLSRSWNVMHAIDERSPLFGATAESLAASEAELHVLVVGLDDITMQTVHAIHHYHAQKILLGRRHADVLSEDEDGNVTLDLGKFHETEPV